MTLRFPYQHEPLAAPPPSLTQSATGRWRPLVPVLVTGPPGQSMSFGKALVDSGADDTIFPIDVATILGVTLLPPSGHSMRWRGQRFPLRFGALTLELADISGNSLRWNSVVGFTPVAIKYPLLGVCGCLEYFDLQLLGEQHLVDWEPNAAFAVVAMP